jgi:hypothetical protein
MKKTKKAVRTTKRSAAFQHQTVDCPAEFIEHGSSQGP